MSLRTRILLCRLAFLALCAMPTSWVLAAVVTRYWPGQEANFVREWSRQLGVRVHFSRLSFPRPNITLAENVELSDPETGAMLATARLVEIRQTPRSLKITASQAECYATQLSRLGEAFHERLLRSLVDDSQACELIAAELTLHTASGKQTLTELRGEYRGSVAGPQLLAGFRVAGLDLPQPAQVRMLRNRQLKPPATRIEFHTGGGDLPLTLFPDDGAMLNAWGSHAHFRGQVWAMQGERGWQGELSGLFSHIDLDRLVTERFPHKLSGEATLSVRGARLENGRLAELAGELTAGPGVIGKSLVASAGESLRLALSPRIPAGDSTLLQYRRLACGFALRGDELILAGRCSDKTPGVLLADDAGALLTVKEGAAPSAVGLVRTLVPRSDVLVPATEETNFLIGSLPTPAVLEPPSSIARPPRGHIHGPADTNFR